MKEKQSKLLVQQHKFYLLKKTKSSKSEIVDENTVKVIGITQHKFYTSFRINLQNQREKIPPTQYNNINKQVS